MLRKENKLTSLVKIPQQSLSLVAMMSLQNANWAQQQVHKQTHSNERMDGQTRILLVSLKGFKINNNPAGET